MSEYLVKEIVPTLQGEGANTGMAVVLLRFSGCNLRCPWCDTEHQGAPGMLGGTYRSTEELVQAAADSWKAADVPPSVLCTGGEPLLQLDEALIREFRRRGIRIFLETNGTIPVPPGTDWVCVSPKDDGAMVTSGDEVKLIWPSAELTPKLWEERSFTHRWIQPRYDGSYDENLRLSVEMCLSNPRWRLSLQTHRYAGIP